MKGKNKKNAPVFIGWWMCRSTRKLILPALSQNKLIFRVKPYVYTTAWIPCPPRSTVGGESASKCRRAALVFPLHVLRNRRSRARSPRSRSNGWRRRRRPERRVNCLGILGMLISSRLPREMGRGGLQYCMHDMLKIFDFLRGSTLCFKSHLEGFNVVQFLL